MMHRNAFGLALLTLGLIGWGTVANAYAPNPDLLKVKGYSPETISAITTQASRQQWQAPDAPARTPKEQVKRNIFINDWAGNFDPFASIRIRERQ